MNAYKDGSCYTYLLYAVYVFEKGIGFGEKSLTTPKKIEIRKTQYLNSQFFQKMITTIRKIFIDEEKESKDPIQCLNRIENYLKWLFFYTMETENIIIVNAYVKIILEIYEKSNLYIY